MPQPPVARDEGAAGLYGCAGADLDRAAVGGTQAASGAEAHPRPGPEIAVGAGQERGAQPRAPGRAQGQQVP